MSILASPAARPAAVQLPPELSRLPDESLRAYGPVVASQCDHAGRPIQRYVTILVECQGGVWLLRRSVTGVNSPGSAARLVEMTITADDARRWLADNPSAAESRA